MFRSCRFPYIKLSFVSSGSCLCLFGIIIGMAKTLVAATVALASLAGECSAFGSAPSLRSRASGVRSLTAMSGQVSAPMCKSASPDTYKESQSTRTHTRWRERAGRKASFSAAEGIAPHLLCCTICRAPFGLLPGAENSQQYVFSPWKIWEAKEMSLFCGIVLNSVLPVHSCCRSSRDLDRSRRRLRRCDHRHFRPCTHTHTHTHTHSSHSHSSPRSMAVTLRHPPFPLSLIRKFPASTCASPRLHLCCATFHHHPRTRAPAAERPGPSGSLRAECLTRHV